MARAEFKTETPGSHMQGSLAELTSDEVRMLDRALFDHKMKAREHPNMYTTRQLITLQKLHDSVEKLKR